MRIGLCYDLRQEYLAMGYSEEETAEFDRPDTIAAIEGVLRELGHETDRVGHLRQLVGRLHGGATWDLVFNIAEGLHGFGREAQVPALLEAWRIPFTFSDTLVSALTLHKGHCKRVVRDLGVATPDFFVIEDERDIERFEEANLPFPLFVKPVAEGTGKGVDTNSRVEDPAALRRMATALLARYRQPVLVETFLPGREFTVGILGTGREAEALGVIEIVLLAGAERDAYSYVNKERCEDLVEYRLVAADDPVAGPVRECALQAWRGLGCRDAGRVDIRADLAGKPHFLEVNPLSGLHPEHSDLPILATLVGMPYRELIRRIVASAAERVGG